MSEPRVNCIGRISTIQFEPRYGREDDTMKARACGKFPPAPPFFN